ncbi:MAG: DUF1508 domain-containing protein [Bacilli bacterium]|nr:DUF1508 domain-containing protein [Bacilli bacterium]
MGFWFFGKKKKKAEEAKVEETKAVEEVKEEPAPVEEKKAARVSKGKYEVFPVGDVYMYRLKASNGEILAYSEVYKSKDSCINAIETVKKNIETGHIDTYEDKHNLWQFTLLATNKRVLVVSSNYGTKKACESAAESFKKFAFTSPVVELAEVPDHVAEEISYDMHADKEGGKIVLEPFESQYYYQIYANNGHLLCTSSPYSSRKSALESVERFKAACNGGKFFLFKDKKGLYQYKLYSKDGRCLAMGETYSDKSRAIKAAQSLASFVDKATLVDNSEAK